MDDSEEFSPDKQKSSCCWKWTKRLLWVLLALIILGFIGMFVTYMVLLGFGDEEHTSGTQGTCSSGSSLDTLKVMSYNAFLILCSPGVKCEPDMDVRTDRVEKIAAWFQDRDEDVVLFQEVWSLQDELRDGMAEAGFCHYVLSTKFRGSGLAVFSKHPIVEHDFKDWFDAFGAGEGMAPNVMNIEAYLGDKGVLYTQITKDDRTFHIMNTHTQSDSVGDGHPIRLQEYAIIHDFVESKNVDDNDLVLYGGDFNEDKYCTLYSSVDPKCDGEEFYDAMLEVLKADLPPITSELQYTVSTVNNTIMEALWEGTESHYRELLIDFVFYHTGYLIPEDSSFCEVVRPLGPSGEDLSDHLPITCQYDVF